MTHTSSSPYLIGIDIGTSGAKSVVIDRSGRLLAWAGQEYPIDTPRPGWAEQDSEAWYRAAVRTVRQALAESGVDARQVVGIGLAGQMHSLVCLGQDEKPLRPAILWADQRSTAEVKAITEHLGVERLAALAGNPAAAGFMLPSWMWLRAHEPQTAAAARWLLLPKDEVRRRLTGAIGAEPSDASSTLLFDPHTLSWSAEMLFLGGLSVEQLPPVRPSAAIAGTLLPAAAQEMGLPPGIPVVHGGSDQSMQALGQGLIEPGQLACTIGTGGQLFAPLRSPQHDPALRLHLFCHALPDRWHLLAATLSAGLALRWARDNLWQGASYAGLADGAGQVEAALEGLFFLPYLAGERTPHMDPTIRAMFAGLDRSHSRSHLVRAVMEGVVFSLKQGFELLEKMGVPVERILSAGGSTRHPLWLQLQADIFNRPVYPATTQEATARGAAILAGIGTGAYASAQEAVAVAVRPTGQGVEPDPGRAAGYGEAYQRYLSLYPAAQAAGVG